LVELGEVGSRQGMDGFIDDALVVALVEEGPYLIELCDRMDELCSFIDRRAVPSFSNASMSSMNPECACQYAGRKIDAQNSSAYITGRVNTHPLPHYLQWN